jgi:hypothetical protein
MKKISLLAALGYFAGVGAYYLQEQIFPEHAEHATEIKAEGETSYNLIMQKNENSNAKTISFFDAKKI